MVERTLVSARIPGPRGSSRRRGPAAPAPAPGSHHRGHDGTRGRAGLERFRHHRHRRTRAGLSLADFRDAFPSKGAVLAGLSRKIDRSCSTARRIRSRDEIAEGASVRRADAPARCHGALPARPGKRGRVGAARRPCGRGAQPGGPQLDALHAGGGRHRLGGPTGAIKLQGLVFAWARVLSVWFEDSEPGLARTMAALDRELKRGETLSARGSTTSIGWPRLCGCWVAP